MTLAIAAPSFSQPSETFIRAHVRTISYDETVLLCQDGRGAEELGRSVLSNLDPYSQPQSVVEKIWNSLRFRWKKKYNRSLAGINEQRVHEFFIQHKVTHCLAEFGPTGCLLHRVAKNANVRFFVHFHGYDATSLPRDKAWRQHYIKMFRDAEGIIAPSSFILDRLVALGCPRDKMYVSSCGINPSDFVESQRQAGMVLAIGRFVEKKAPLSTIKAFAKVASLEPHAQLHMVGDGPLLKEAHNLALTLDLSDRIVFHGSQSHDAVQLLLRKAAVFVQHSVTASNGDTEGLPVAILEAMASSLPVVSTRHSGIPDVVSDGVTGFLVDEHDITGMANNIIYLLQYPELAASMGQAGAPRIKNQYSHAATAARLRKIMGINNNAS